MARPRRPGGYHPPTHPPTQVYLCDDGRIYFSYNQFSIYTGKYSSYTVGIAAPTPMPPGVANATRAYAQAGYSASGVAFPTTVFRFDPVAAAVGTSYCQTSSYSMTTVNVMGPRGQVLSEQPQSAIASMLREISGAAGESLSPTLMLQCVVNICTRYYEGVACIE